jgi:3-deoxy-manno-octulosonate cytidylyltransferase (CMP-KDO synthetase)
MIWHVYRRVQRAERVGRVIVATDDGRILKAVKDFGGEAVITSGEHPTGTDRVAEVAAGLGEEIILDVQGDEPLILPQAVDEAVEPLLHDASLQMTTLAHPLDDAAELQDPDVVKVICDTQGYAVDFFRQPMKDDISESNVIHMAGATSKPQSQKVLRHIGLYGFRRAYLLQLAALEPTGRERALGLEQLRPLKHGCRIKVIETDYRCLGVDRPEDIEKAERLLVAEAECMKQTEREALS